MSTDPRVERARSLVFDYVRAWDRVQPCDPAIKALEDYLTEQFANLEDALAMVRNSADHRQAEISRLTAELEEARKDAGTRTEGRLRMIFNAWNEFGPEHGFGELMDRLQDGAEPASSCENIVTSLKACLHCFDEMRGRKPQFVEDAIAMSKEAIAAYEAAAMPKEQPHGSL